MRPEAARLGGTMAALALLLGAGCGSEKTSAAPQSQTGAGSSALTITDAPVEARAIQRTAETTGSLLAWDEVVLSMSVPGTVTRVLVDLGDRVEAGRVVAELDGRELALLVEQAEATLRSSQESLRRARAQGDASRAGLGQIRDSRRALEAGLSRATAVLEEARVNLERSRALAERQLIAERELDAARTQYESALAQFQTAQVELDQYPDRVRAAEAQLQSELAGALVAESEIKRREAELGLARKRLSDATLRTPISGAVAKRHVNPGEFVKDNAPVVTLVRSDPLKYRGTVPESSALDVHPGQVLRLQVDAAPGRTFTGRVSRVSPAVDVANRTAVLEGEVPNPRGALKPGLFARGAVEVRREEGVPFVPEAAVSQFVGITKVFVVADGKVEERVVKLGARRDGMVEIVEGVRPGERVATSSVPRLYDGAPVTVAPASAR